MDLVLGLQKHFLLPAFTGADGFVDQAGGFQLRRADLLLSDLLPVGNTDAGADAQTDQTNDDCNNNRRNHKLAAHLLLIKMGAEGVGVFSRYSFVHENEPADPAKIKAKRHRA